MQYRIIMASSKGGVGKSTSAALLAASLCARGKRVLVCDLDFGTRCLDMFFGVENNTVYDVGDVYLDRIEAARAIMSLEVEGDGALFFVPSSLSLRPDEVDSETLCDVLEALSDEAKADYVICDTAGSVISEKIAPWANLGLICATQMPASLRSAEASADRLRRAGLSTMRLIITSFDYREAKSSVRAGIISVIDGASIRAIGVIPSDRELLIAQEHGKMPGPKSPAMIAYTNVAARLCGEDRKVFYGIRGMKGRFVL